ncbi:MAG: hypothetical protein ABI359_05855 [Ginsengibacter sp.]
MVNGSTPGNYETIICGHAGIAAGFDIYSVAPLKRSLRSFAKYFIRGIFPVSCCLFLFTHASNAQIVRYVSTTVSDVTGTGILANPYKTILKGVTSSSKTAVDTVSLLFEKISLVIIV